MAIPQDAPRPSDADQPPVRGDAVRAAESWQRAILESALDCIISIDRQGRVIEFNPAAEQTFGYRREDVIGRPLATLIVPPEHRAAHLEGMQRYLATGVSPILGKRLLGLPALKSDGSVFPTELTIVPMELGGELVFTAFVRDITKEQDAERKRQEALTQLEDARQKAVAADQAKMLFLANMSHEFRTPMAAVVGYGEMLLDPQVGAAERTKLVRSINRNGRHLLALINDVLDLTKFEAGKLELESVPCRPWKNIEDALSVVEVLAAERGVTLLPEAVGALPRSMLSDPTRLRQILVNLLSNAVKFSPTGGKVHVRARLTDSAERRLVFEVEDQGIGISKEEVRRLFRPFTQADPSTTRRYGGTGLGLSIVAKLVQLMGGRIDVRSRPGVGSCFTVSLPLRGVDFNALTTPEELLLESRQTRRSLKPLRRLEGRVLLADDNPDNRNIVRYFLERAGLLVEEVGDGKAALNRASAGGFDLIILDMQMPEVDGYSVATTLRQRGTRTAILALTAHAMAGDEEKCLRAGCDAYLTKPVDPDRLLLTVSEHMGRESRRPQNDVPLLSLAATSLPRPDQIDHLIAIYVNDLPGKVDAIQQALTDQDFGRLRELSHRLKGSAGMYGLPQVSETAGLIEQACVEGQDPELLAELIGELRQTVSSQP